MMYVLALFILLVGVNANRELCRDSFPDKAIAHDAIDLEVLAGFIISPINDVERCVRVCENEWGREVRNRRPFVRCRAVYFNPHSRSNATRCVALSKPITQADRQLTFEQNSYVYNACPPNSRHRTKLKLIDEAFHSRKEKVQPSKKTRRERLASRRKQKPVPQIKFKPLPSSAERFSINFPDAPKIRNESSNILKSIHEQRKHRNKESKYECDIVDDEDRYGDYICGVRGSPPHCALAPHAAGKAPDHQYPWLVSLWNGDSFICTGSLIQADFTNQNVRWTEFVITAASCLIDDFGRFIDTTLLHVVAGRDKLGPAEVNFRKYNIANVWVPPDYTGKETHLDIGLVRLDRWMLFTPEIHQVCLPEEGFSPSALDQCVTVGWGWTTPFEESRGAKDEPLHVPVEEGPVRKCREENEVAYPDAPLRCVKSTTHVDGDGKPHYASLCPGDAGAPLMCVHKGRWTLVGTAAKTPLRCSTGRFTVFTDLLHVKTRRLLNDGFVTLLRKAGESIFT